MKSLRVEPYPTQGLGSRMAHIRAGSNLDARYVQCCPNEMVDYSRLIFHPGNKSRRRIWIVARNQVKDAAIRQNLTGGKFDGLHLH